jgi:hypothetical protein
VIQPYWFKRIVWDSERAARRHAYQAGGYYDQDPESDAAFLGACAEWFPKLLAEALAATTRSHEIDHAPLRLPSQPMTGSCGAARGTEGNGRRQG